MSVEHAALRIKLYRYPLSFLCVAFIVYEYDIIIFYTLCPISIDIKDLEYELHIE
jgi:hypothetical protein